jgi:hypothetical protein
MEPTFRETLESLGDLPIVGDVRGAGFFWAVELVKDRETNERFTDDESDRLLRDLLTPKLIESGLICRADDRGDPVVQLSPPLIMEDHHFEEMAAAMRAAFAAAWDALQKG